MIHLAHFFESMIFDDAQMLSIVHLTFTQKLSWRIKYGEFQNLLNKCMSSWPHLFQVWKEIVVKEWEDFTLTFLEFWLLGSFVLKLRQCYQTTKKWLRRKLVQKRQPAMHIIILQEVFNELFAFFALVAKIFVVFTNWLNASTDVLILQCFKMIN